MTRAGPKTELYLVLLVTGGDTTADARLAAALEAAPVASLLLKAAESGAPLSAQSVLPLIARAQQRGVAVLLYGDPALARTVKADGVHLPFSKTIETDFATAREILGKGAIIGADAGRSRHDAMTMGEAGADYVAFGIPEHVSDRDGAHERQLDLIGWWSELFEIPCVAFNAPDAPSVSALAGAGADFVAVTLPDTIEAVQVAAFFAPYLEAPSGAVATMSDA